MGLGLFLTADIPPRGLLRRRPNPRDFLDQVARTMAEAIDDPLAKRFTSLEASDRDLDVCLYPAEEPVKLAIHGEKDLVVSAKTSSAGPGYHAMLVDLLELVGDRLGLVWRWSDGEGGPGDETGYREHRDFQRLQKEMIVQLRTVARIVTGPELGDTDDLSPIGLSMPVGYTVRSGAFAISPMGYWDRSWFERFCDCTDDDASLLAEAFFPWWHEGWGARTWQNCGLALAWLDVPWSSPKTDAEREYYELALACFERAADLDPGIDLPHEDIADMRRLLRETEDAISARQAGIGFRRNTMRLPLSGSWTIELPGYFHHAVSKDGRTALYWFADRTVRATGYWHANSSGNNPSSSGQELEPGDQQSGAMEFLDSLASTHRKAIDSSNIPPGSDGAFEFRDDDQGIWAGELPQEEAGHRYWVLNAGVVRGEQACLVTLAYDDPATGRGWALEVMRTVDRPMMDEEQFAERLE